MRYFLVFAALLVIAFSGDYAFGETWKVQIPAGSAEPTSLAHFLPTEISVRIGDQVEWGNADAVAHTVTSGSLESGPTGIFDSGYMNPGGRFTFFFDETNLGQIKYFCTIHPWMIGVVNVVDLAPGFQVYHNVGSDVSDEPIDIEYKLQRNLVSVDVDTIRNTLTFNFEGKINNDRFLVRLPDELIRSPQSVWINDRQTTDYTLTQLDGVTTLTIVLDDAVQQVKIMGTDVIGKFKPKKHVLINQMFGVTDKKFYERGDTITISGEIRNPSQLYRLSLDIVSPEGVVVHHREVPLVDFTKFSETIQTGGILREFGKYMVNITGSDAKSLFLSFEYGIKPSQHLSPKKQIDSGIVPGEILCNEGLELLMKISNGNAACVKESTAMILIQRGWADYF